MGFELVDVCEHRCFPWSCLRLRDRASSAIRGRMAYSCLNGGCSGRGIPSQGRTLSNVDQNDGFPSTGRRGAQTYLEAIRMEDRRTSLSQSRDGEQPRQFRVSLHSGCHFHGPQSDTGSQKLQPGVEYRRRLSKLAHLPRKVCQE